MDDAGRRIDVLSRIVSAMEQDLPRTESDDIRSFIAAGEYGLAVDTLFCAIAEDGIAVGDDVLQDLSSVRELYNTFGDMDPRIVTGVLERSRQPRVSAR